MWRIVVISCFYHLISMVVTSSSWIDQFYKENQEMCGENNMDRIIGGKVAALGQYPWMIQLAYHHDDGIFLDCGGSLISRDYVLSAAHCYLSASVFDLVIVGDYNTSTDPDCDEDYCAEPRQIIPVGKIWIHNEYESKEYKNDIMLVRLARPANSMVIDWVMPICLPTGNEHFTGFAEVAGWGMTDPSNKTSVSDVLYFLKLPILSMSDCREFIQFELDDRKQICGGYDKQNQDTCGGDSGGPLMQMANTDDGPKQFLVGLVSYGPDPCGQTAAIYTNITYYLPFIFDKMISSSAEE